MKFCKRLLCVLLCCLLCLPAFSVGVKAEEIAHSAYHVYTVVNAKSASGNQTLVTGMHYPHDSTRQNITGSHAVYTPSSGGNISLELYVANSDKTVLWDSGSIVEGKLENIYFISSVVLTGIATSSLELEGVTGYLLYSDSSSETITATVEKDRNGYYLINFNFTAQKDVSQIYFILTTESYPTLCASKSVEVTVTTGEPTTAQESNTNIVWGSLASDVQSVESGWLAKIWSKLTSGFQNMVDAIVGLPERIWSFFEDGLKGLFVPDEEYIVSYKAKWEQLMSEELGAVWQVVEVTFGAWEEINVADETNTISMPEVSIPLPDDNEFTFGGYEVKIVPDKFEFLASALKTMAGICATFMFANGLRKRYDEVMGVEK